MPGRCAERIRLLARLPLPPEECEHLLEVWLVKGTQATTAIEGNTLTEADIRRIVAGQRPDRARPACGNEAADGSLKHKFSR